MAINGANMLLDGLQSAPHSQAGEGTIYTVCVLLTLSDNTPMPVRRRLSSAINLLFVPLGKALSGIPP